MTAAQRLSADGMIDRSGQPVTLTRNTAGSYDPSTGSASSSTSTSTGKGVILPFGPGVRYMSGTNVTADDKQCFLSALDSAGSTITAPKVGDTITDANSVVYEITEVSPLAPAGLDIFYTLTVRAAQ